MTDDADPTLRLPAVAPPDPQLRALLTDLGVDAEELARAEADGTLPLLAIERLALDQDLRYDIAEAAEVSGLGVDRISQVWRSLGFPVPDAEDKVFSDVDVANFRAVARLLAHGVIDPEVTMQLTRVIGSSMARVSEALVDAVTNRDDEIDRPGGGGGLYLDVPDTGTFLPVVPAVLEQVWRRHLQVAARRRFLRSSDDEAVTVGFADLVGFTALAQQVSDAELAEVVEAFERLAYDVVVAGGGRVVKMIGDEVMFMVEDPAAAVEIALDLADASRDAAGLSDVRVGLAMGPVLEREGDAFGATVNRASRITAIAYPGTVVVSPEVRDALEDHLELVFRGMRPRSLKHIGRVQLAVARRAEDGTGTIREAIDDRRRQMRERMRLVLPARLLDPRGEEGDEDEEDQGRPDGDRPAGEP
jgi:adenylate cyclase